MRKQIQVWGLRIAGLALVIYAVVHWGVPLYKQYFVPKKAVVFIPTTRVRQGKLVISFHELGTLAAKNSVEVRSEITGKIISIAPEGKAVKAGDKIVELDTTEIDRDVRERLLAYQNSLNEVSRAKADEEMLKASNRTALEQAQAQLDFDKTELQRAIEDRDRKKRLAEEKLVPLADVEAAELQVRSKELAVKKGEMDLALKIKENESKETQKKAEVGKVIFASNLAKAALEEVEGRRKGATIVAPSSGMLVLGSFYRDGVQKYKVGDTIERRQMVCSIPDLSQMQVKVNVGEADAPKVRVGQQVLVRLEALPQRAFVGDVTAISALATEGRWWESPSTAGRKSFDVVIDLRKTDPKRVKPGMTADVEFICDVVPRAVYVPLECVQEHGTRTYCFVKKGRRYEKRLVTTGKQNDNFIAITKGLKPGEVVALRDPTKEPEEEDLQPGAPGKRETQPAPIPETNGNK